MSTPTELINALLARGRKTLWFREPGVETPPGEFPPGWRDWFAAMPRREDGVTGAAPAAIVDLMAARPLAPPPPRSADLSRWQVIAALARPQWHRATPDTRPERRIAAAASAVLHLLLVWLLFVIPYGRPDGPRPSEQGDNVVQVEFIGDGTPEDSGGGVPDAQVQQDQASEAQAARPAQATPPPPMAASTPPAPASQASATEPQPTPEVPAQQPLQVTQTPEPDNSFVLPPTTPPELRVDVPQAQRPTVQARQRDIELVQAPTAPVVQPQLVVTSPQVTPRPVERQVQMREIPTLARPQALPQLEAQPASTSRLDAPVREARTRDIALASASSTQPAATQPAAGTSPTATTQRQGNAQSPAAASGQPRSESGNARQPVASGRGNDAARPGAPPGSRRNDDWGDSNRNRPGGNAGNAGLYNADGSPRLPPGTAAPGGGFPPGGDDWSREQLDRHGTWATRPPLGYEPTRFDQYWIPSGSLLQEWVRRGVRSVAIPIPGSSKKINCVLSVLQLGGGCGISDDNLQDEEAVARPPPEVPFKPELQEPVR